VIRSFLPLLLITTPAFAAAPAVLVSGLKNPAAVASTADGRIFVTTLSDSGKTNGGIVVVKDGKAEPFATGMLAPAAMIAFQQSLYVIDGSTIYSVDLKSAAVKPWVEAKDFPNPPKHLSALAADEKGTLYVTDAFAQAVYRVAAISKGKGKEPDRKVTLLASAATHPALGLPAGIVVDGLNHLLILNRSTGVVNRLRMPDLAVEFVAKVTPDDFGICFDHFGRLYGCATGNGPLWAIPRPGAKPVVLATSYPSTGNLCHDPVGNRILTVNAKDGTLSAVPAQPPGYEVDETPLKLETEVTFKDLTWTGWDSGADSGKVTPLRPIVLTHAGDGSNRIFVATQHGVIHNFKDEAGPRATNVFLDIQSKVLYKDNENEQGLLGLAFHPKYKSNGELFVFYTDKTKRLQNVISRFRVSKTDPNKVDPNSEEELLRVSHKFWNHDGGTICFGPDGYLYIVLGDGGSGGDPDQNGQNKATLLGKILRIDVDRKDSGLAYAIPKDNPFVNEKDTKPEIYCLGVRNPWRMAFDRKTGQGWFGEVGQNLWEEINLIEKGGNYGWSVRESLHPFGPKGTGPQPGMIEPIWEYHHSVGKSITGGHVYRGTNLPELDGLYLYADYVSGKLWALKYDFDKKRVVANRTIKDVGSPILSYGEDESGEVYLMTFSATGKGISRFVRSK
jgi:glucose/arabinose dehydrogenase